MLHRRHLGAAAASIAAGVLHTESARAQSANLLSVIQHSPMTSRFAELLKNSGAEGEFSQSGRRTAFIPSNGAIEQIPAIRMQDFLGNKAKLRTLILNHLVEGAMPINLTISDSGNMGTDQFRSLGGQVVAVSFGSGGVPRVNGVPVVLANVAASNGFVHVISGVIES